MTTLADEISLTVSFDVSRTDLEACAARVVRAYATRGSRLRTVLILLTVAILVGVLVYKASPVGGTPWIGVGLYSAVAIWVLWNGLRRRQNLVHRVTEELIANRGGEDALGQERITISSGGIRSDDGSVTVIQQWTGVESIESAEDAVYITIGKASFFRIPRRAFGSDAAADEFVLRADAWHRGANDSACADS